jgi:hypothetical protein
MAKAEKPVQHRARSEDEMRQALTALLGGLYGASIPPHYDTPEVVLSDAIDEVIELRQIREKVRAFAQSLSTELTRR